LLFPIEFPPSKDASYLNELLHKEATTQKKFHSSLSSSLKKLLLKGYFLPKGAPP